MQEELSTIIKKSFQLMDEKRYKSAIELLSSNLKKYPDSIEILTQIAKCYDLMEEKDRASDYYEKAFEINNYSTIVLDPLIEFQIKNENYNKAEFYADFYLKCEDKTYAIQKYLETLTKIKHFDGIEKFAQTADENFLSSVSLSMIADAYCEIAINLDKENSENEEIEQKLSISKNYAQKSLDLDANNISAICVFAKCYLTEKNYQEINELFKKNPLVKTSYEFLNIMGSKEYYTGNFEGAIKCFSEAIKLNQDYANLYYNLSESYLQQDWYDEAEIAIKQAIALDEKNVDYRLTLANIYYLKREYDKTLLTLSYVHDFEPDNVKMNIFYVYTYAEQENFEKANEYVKKLEGKEELNYLNSTLASIYFSLGRKEEAYKKLEEAIKKEPENNQLLMKKANFLLQDNKTDELLNMYDKILENNPNYVDAYYQKAYFYYHYLHNQEKALENARTAVEMDCNNVEYQFLLANIYYYCIKNYDKALEHAKISLSIDPNDIEKYSLVGKIYLHKEDVASADMYFKEILLINPQAFDTIYDIAYILNEKKEAKYAYEYYQKAYRINPFNYDFIRDYSDFVINEVSAFKGIKILLNFSSYTENKNLKTEAKNRAKRLIKENQKELNFKEKLQFIFK